MALLLSLAHCGVPPTGGGPGCTTGMTVACACRDGTQGVQTCNARHEFDPCECGESRPDAGVGPSDVVNPPGPDVTTPPPPDAMTMGSGCTVRIDETSNTVFDSCPPTEICRCASGLFCEGTGTCVAALPHRYGIFVLEASLAPRRPNGTPWDGNNSNPDLAVVIALDGTVLGASETRFDTLMVSGNPLYQTVGMFHEGSEMMNGVVDVDGDTSMGQYELAVACPFGPVTAATMRSRILNCNTASGSMLGIIDPL